MSHFSGVFLEWPETAQIYPGCPSILFNHLDNRLECCRISNFHCNWNDTGVHPWKCNWPVFINLKSILSCDLL